MTAKRTALLLAAVLALGTVSLTSCGNADMDEAGKDVRRTEDRIENGVKDAADDLFSVPDDGTGDGDIYDRGIYDDNGVNTNEGSADGGTRTAEDNTRGAVYHTDRNDGVIGGRDTADGK